MVEKILIVAAIALVIGLVLWWFIRRSVSDDEEQQAPAARRSLPSGPRGSMPSGPGRSAMASGPGSMRAPDSLATQMNWLVGMGGDVQGKTFHVGNRTGTIGRGLGNFIQTTDPDASRVHCQFMPVPSGLQLRDMESSNGTFLNGQRVTVALLSDGDQVRIGKAVFVYRARGDFNVDFGVQQRKVAGSAVSKQTALGNVADLRTMIQQALDAAGGDIPRAAASMGVKPEHFLIMIAQYGLSNEPKR